MKKRMDLTIEKELLIKLKELADADGRTVSNYVEQLIKQHIKELHAKGKH